jgi:hypothetical protein
LLVLLGFRLNADAASAAHAAQLRWNSFPLLFVSSFLGGVLLCRLARFAARDGLYYPSLGALLVFGCCTSSFASLGWSSSTGNG